MAASEDERKHECNKRPTGPASLPEYRYSVEELQNDPGCECSVCLQVCSEVQTSPLKLLAPTAHSFMSRVVDLGTVPLHH